MVIQFHRYFDVKLFKVCPQKDGHGGSAVVKHRIHLHMCENACIITHLLYLIFVYHKHDKHICNVIHVVIIIK